MRTLHETDGRIGDLIGAKMPKVHYDWSKCEIQFQPLKYLI